MSDLIRREDAIDALDFEIVHMMGVPNDEKNISNPFAQYNKGLENGIKAIRTLPSAEPKQKTGEWMLYESRSDIYDLEGVCTWGRAYRCSECGFIHWVIEDFGIYSFCPNCGADMRDTL